MLPDLSSQFHVYIFVIDICAMCMTWHSACLFLLLKKLKFSIHYFNVLLKEYYYRWVPKGVQGQIRNEAYDETFFKHFAKNPKNPNIAEAFVLKVILKTWPGFARSTDGGFCYNRGDLYFSAACHSQWNWKPKSVDVGVLVLENFLFCCAIPQKDICLINWQSSSNMLVIMQMKHEK